LNSPDEAADLTQGFFCHFIKHNVSAAAGRDRGRFRTFVLACFKNFINDQWRHRHRSRDIPQNMITSFNTGPDTARMHRKEPSACQSVEPEADRFWAKTVHQRVLRQMQDDYELRRKGPLFALLSPLLSGEPPARSYGQLAASIGMSSGALKVEVMRLRHRFRQRFREEAADTLEDPADVDSECRYLLSLLFIPQQA
jgi:RNA polymerase sigma-70 factor (ECF subfamily)